jgi:pimeloyl-ACP methyl ester carboxylesterase
MHISLPSNLWIITHIALLYAGGCGVGQPANPSFALSSAQARTELMEMERAPVAFERPVVVLSGYRDVGIVPWRLVPQLQRLGAGERVIGVTFRSSRDFDECREKVIEAVDAAFPSDDPEWTAEVDVVAVSMGGLVARYAAGELPDGAGGKRLRIARLFTISTPHRGAQLAFLPTWNDLHRGMRSDSDFLRQLNDLERNPSYDLHPYVRLCDLTVGPPNAAPAGEAAWWVPAMPMQLSHHMAFDDPRILADIARRLRGEAAYATEPRAPLP